jgi:hypothetical protein
MTVLPGLFSMTGPEVYESAVAHPRRSLEGCGLDGARVELNRLNRPKGRNGNFAVVYHLTDRPEGNERHTALRCFLRLAQDAADRYERISEHLLNHVDGRGCLVTTKYFASGVETKEGPKPVTTMPWIDGLTLDTYVEAHCNEPYKISKLASDIRRIAQELRRAGIAHGDLQHRNMIIAARTEALKLIDYDGMYVPSLAGRPSNELGLDDFQHPGRDSRHFGPGLDDFSLAVIYLTLIALARHSEVWDLRPNEDGLLLRRSDFLNPAQSDLLAHLETRADLRKAVALFKRMCEGNIEDVLPLDAFIREGGLDEPASTVPAHPSPVFRSSVVEAPTRPDASPRLVLAHRPDGIARALGEPVILAGRFERMAGTQKQAVLKLASTQSVEVRVPGLVVHQLSSRSWGVDRGSWVAATGGLEVDNDSVVFVEIASPMDLERWSDGEANRRLAQGGAE